MGRPPKSNNPLNTQLEEYLKKNSDYHYAGEEEVDYVVSSGSLIMDIEMGGGIRPGIVRSSG